MTGRARFTAGGLAPPGSRPGGPGAPCGASADAQDLWETRTPGRARRESRYSPDFRLILRMCAPVLCAPASTGPARFRPRFSFFLLFSAVAILHEDGGPHPARPGPEPRGDPAARSAAQSRGHRPARRCAAGPRESPGYPCSQHDGRDHSVMAVMAVRPATADDSDWPRWAAMARPSIRSRPRLGFEPRSAAGGP